MNEQVANNYTTDEIVHVLHETLNDPGREGLVIDGLKAYREKREAEARLQEGQQQIVDITELYQRSSGSTSNIEGVYSDLEDTSLIFLHTYSKIETPSSLETSAAEAAATAFVYLAVQQGDFERLDGAGVLRGSGVDTIKLMDHFRQGLKRAWGVVDDSPEDRNMQATLATFESLADKLYLQLGPEEWKFIVDPPMQKLRRALLDKGVQLRQLNENGKYDEEEV